MDGATRVNSSSRQDDEPPVRWETASHRSTVQQCSKNTPSLLHVSPTYGPHPTAVGKLGVNEFRGGGADGTELFYIRGKVWPKSLG